MGRGVASAGRGSQCHISSCTRRTERLPASGRTACSLHAAPPGPGAQPGGNGHVSMSRPCPSEEEEGSQPAWQSHGGVGTHTHAVTRSRAAVPGLSVPPLSAGARRPASVAGTHAGQDPAPAVIRPLPAASPLGGHLLSLETPCNSPRRGQGSGKLRPGRVLTLPPLSSSDHRLRRPSASCCAEWAQERLCPGSCLGCSAFLPAGRTDGHFFSTHPPPDGAEDAMQPPPCALPAAIQPRGCPSPNAPPHGHTHRFPGHRRPGGHCAFRSPPPLTSSCAWGTVSHRGRSRQIQEGGALGWVQTPCTFPQEGSPGQQEPPGRGRRGGNGAGGD